MAGNCDLTACLQSVARQYNINYFIHQFGPSSKLNVNRAKNEPGLVTVLN